MTGLGALIKRNCKLFFRDKGMFFTSLITPLILLVLYATFLAKVYRNSFARRDACRIFCGGRASQRHRGRSACVLSAGGMLCDGGFLLQSSDGAG